MNQPSRNTTIKQLRAVVPTRPLTLSESYILAERQATRALTLLGITRPHVGLGWLLGLPKVEVQLAPRFKMDGLSGLTTFTHGRYLILVNKNDSHARRRFTLAHEAKHLLDYTSAPVIHRNLGYGDRTKQAHQVEAICNYFAACLLMPRTWIKREWAAGVQDVTALAGCFTVSEEAMDKRLRFLGYLDDAPRALHTYFRPAGSVEASPV